MIYQIRYTKGAKEDLQRLYAFLLQQDVATAEEALAAIEKSLELLQRFPFTCRKVEEDTPFLRELLIPFGKKGYVALFEIENNIFVTVLAVRHQLEADYQ